MNSLYVGRQHEGNQPLLELKGLTKNFAGLIAVNEVSCNIGQGEMVGVIGPNGAGKTTLLNVINGFLLPTKGEIWFNGSKLNGLAPYQIFPLGITRVFQDKQIFTNMSVIENVIVGIHREGQVGLFQVMVGSKKARRKEKQYLEQANDLLTLVGLKVNPYASAFNLSARERTLLGIARALACKPRILLLDEPVAGLSIEEIDEVADLILRLWRQGMTVILVEHRMEIVMGICGRIIVLNFGQKIADDIPAKIRENEEVITAYLGEKSV